MKRILISGATGGIGGALVRYFFNRGEHVIATGRNRKRLDAFKQELSSAGPGKLTTHVADFASFADVHSLAERLKSDYEDGLDAVIHTAAVFVGKKRYTEDGHELQMQVNHLAPALLSLELLPVLRKRRGRVISTTSELHRKAEMPETPFSESRIYRPLKQYARTKLYNLMFTIALDDRIGENKGMRAFAVHPGLVKTDIGSKETSLRWRLLWRFATRKAIDPGRVVYTYSFLVYEKDTQSALPYFYRTQPRPYSEEARDKAKVERLFEATEAALDVRWDKEN